MNEILLECEDTLRRLRTPVRNNYFYGKLLDASHFQMEQNYFNHKRWLLNRLTLGSGVVCGLKVVPTNDGLRLRIGPGVAIDRLGREIIVPEPSNAFDPREITNECGEPMDRMEGEGTVHICLAYHECESEYVPVLVGECERERDCAPSAIRERYQVLVQEGGMPAIELACTLPDLFNPSEEEGVANIHHRLAERLSEPCREVDGNACVVLAQVTLPPNGDEAITEEMIVNQDVRPIVYSNELLLELLLCLAERGELPSGVRRLDYVSGDAQSAEVEAVLGQPLVVEVMDSEGNPVEGETVTFHVRGGGGGVGDGSAFDETYIVLSDADGKAEAQWRLGSTAGLNILEVTIPSGRRVTFHALAEKIEWPVIKAIWPPSAACLSPQSEDETLAKWYEWWKEVPRLEVTFDREMDKACLEAPEGWLRVFQLTATAENEIRVHRIKLDQAIEPHTPVLWWDGFTVVYKMDDLMDEWPNHRYLVQIRADGENIVDTGMPVRLLDADFAGTKLAGDVLDDIWEVEEGEDRVFSQEVWDALETTGVRLPSGDGMAGGRFHAWFQVGMEG